MLSFSLCLLALTAAPSRDAGHVDAGEEPLPTDLSPLIEFLSTSDGGLPLAKYRWQVPDLDSWVDVPTVQNVNGMPIRFSAAVSKHDVPFLMEFYNREFVRAGLFIPPPEAAESLGLGDRFFQVTGLDTDNLISFTVMLQPTDAQRTTVIMSQGFLQDWLKKKRVAPDEGFAPLFPQATEVVRAHSEGVDTITYSTTASPQAVYAFYDEVMPRSGFKRSAPGVFQRGRDRIKVTSGTSAHSHKGGTATGVLLERRTVNAQ